MYSLYLRPDRCPALWPEPTVLAAAPMFSALVGHLSDGRGTRRHPRRPTWAREVGASERTLSRLFVAETGLSLGRWRTRLRIRTALELLASGTSVAVAGRQVGYRTASAFIAAFRRRWV